MNSSDNYRGISLSNSICKLYDYVFMDLNMDYLKTDDMQFGFKNNHSTVLCTAVYIGTINHYMNEGSDVYSSGYRGTTPTTEQWMKVDMAW